jgi:TetR/AcrR family transcriptional repressor of mexCD-oprJ operon
VQRAVTTTVEALDAGGPSSGPADEALRRVISTSWQQISSFGQLMATDVPARSADHHAPIADRVRELVRRGRAEGSFRTDVPEGWLVATYLALVHAAGQQVATGALPAEEAEAALTATVLGAFGVSRSTTTGDAAAVTSR